ncbi:MAG: hypothetical protein NC338_01355 [Firmicutes bacterium]|nr:hypothetical protein [Bacillota bacterium]MCM1401037.1 hypothetical protein [Bacteroides sp.]MCM1476956.1 hypothetical protein [Bacteroides sp.]
MEYLNLALKAWRDGQNLRTRRSRYKDYTYGRQWGDAVTDAAGNTVTEGSLAETSGFRPHTNNLIRQLVKCVVGNFRSSLAEADPCSTASSLGSELMERNALTELDCRMLEEFLISGCAVQRVVTERRLDGSGVWIDNVSPDRFFVNRFTDTRGLDIELVGMLHSMSLREVLMRFAPEGGERAARLSAKFNAELTCGSLARIGDSVSRSFLEAEEGRCRVIELWTLESRALLRCHDHSTGSCFTIPAQSAAELRAEQSRRFEAAEPQLEIKPVTTLRWHCRFLAPWGEVLQQYDSPYAHGRHPFVVKFYPLIDGEVHSLVEDIIDQQRSINRLITLIDHIMSVSAKGALLLPYDSLAPGMTPADVGRLWAQCNSVIPYRPGKGEVRQMVGGGDNAGAYQLLNLQMDLFRQISGVSGALQGQLTNPNSSAALFDAQVQHSAVAILDLLQTFHSFRSARNRLAASV